MELRYRKVLGEVFVPERKTTNGDWVPFKKKDVSLELEKLCVAIGKIQSGIGQWYYSGEDPENRDIIFTRETYVMAFLGAASYYFNKKIIDFEL